MLFRTASVSLAHGGMSERDARGPEEHDHDPSVRDYADTSPRVASGGEEDQSGVTPKRRCQNSRLRRSPMSQPSSYSGRTNLV